MFLRVLPSQYTKTCKMVRNGFNRGWDRPNGLTKSIQISLHHCNASDGFDCYPGSTMAMRVCRRAYPVAGIIGSRNHKL